MRITVRDDGWGFDTTAKATGFGLMGMRERTELLEGALEVESGLGQGRIIGATFPTRRRSSERVA